MAALPQPADEIDSTGKVLAQCRSELAEALDDIATPTAQPSWQPFGWFRRWMAMRPAWSGALLVLFGVLLGTQVMPWLQVNSLSNSSGQAFNVMAAPQLTPDQLAKMTVTGMNWSAAPGAAPANVQLQLSAQQPLVVSGNVDDVNVRRVLTYVIANGDRSDPGVRLDCLEALKERSHDEQVRRALLAAARKDQYAAVRLKALDSLRDSVSDEHVREAMLDALEHDSNPGVRVEAVNLLVLSLEGNLETTQTLEMPDTDEPSETPERPVFSIPSDPSMERVVRALEELQRRDPSRYVRLRSAAALRQIAPREIH